MADTEIDPPATLVPFGNLTSVDVYITSQCNRRCAYCFLPPDFFMSGQRMSLEAFAGAVTWSKRHDVSEITLLGGEPSLHPDFATMVLLARGGGLDVRVVTNGSRRFRRLLSGKAVHPQDLSRVAVSLDSLDQRLADTFRGPGAWQDAMETIGLLHEHGVTFDINVTGVRSVLDGVEALINFADQAGCRRVNIHWPSAMGLGGGLAADEIPSQGEWETLVQWVRSRQEGRPEFFVEIERGFLAAGDSITGCALVGFSNLQILPDGRAYRCGLLTDQDTMTSLHMEGEQLALKRPAHGEELLAAMAQTCDACPVMLGQGRRACIYDKVRSHSSVAQQG